MWKLDAREQSKPKNTLKCLGVKFMQTTDVSGMPLIEGGHNLNTTSRTVLVYYSVALDYTYYSHARMYFMAVLADSGPSRGESAVSDIGHIVE